MPFVPIGTRPATWFVCFFRTSPAWWVRTFIPGRWKHVGCFGKIPGQNAWVFFNFAFDGAELAVVPDNQRTLLNEAMGNFLENARVLEYQPPAERRRGWQPIATCVSEVASMIGTPSRALHAGRLMRDLLAEKARIVQEPDESAAGEEAGSGGVGGERGEAGGDYRHRGRPRAR